MCVASSKRAEPKVIGVTKKPHQFDSQVCNFENTQGWGRGRTGAGLEEGSVSRKHTFSNINICLLLGYTNRTVRPALFWDRTLEPLGKNIDFGGDLKSNIIIIDAP